jgi:hypothetical protein
MENALKSHPAYSEGFFDRLEGAPIPDDATPEYRAGWEAAEQSRRIIESAGLKETAPGQFSATFTFSPSREGEA